MFCPTCSAEAVPGQRFCKGCGTNIQLVSDALSRGDDTLGQLRVDVEALKNKAVDFAKGIGAEVSEAVQAHNQANISKGVKRDTNPIQAQAVTKPKDYLSYSWQHNLKDGIMTLLGGVGLGVLLYYLSRAGLEAGTIEDMETKWQIRGLTRLAQLIWFFALIPVLKGLGQIFYAAFFAESIATLATRFAPPPVQQISIQPPQPTQNFANVAEPPSSVTEHTTQFFEDAKH